jgi:hypothetical protein
MFYSFFHLRWADNTSVFLKDTLFMSWQKWWNLGFFFKTSLLVHDSHKGSYRGFHCPIYIYIYIYIYDTILVYCLHWSLCSPTLFLEMTSTDFNVPYLYMYRRCPNHSHPPLPYPSSYYLPLNMTSLHSCPSLF